MKRLILIIAMTVIAMCGQSQTKIFEKRDVLPLSAKFAGCFLAGSFRAQVEVLDNSYGAFQKRFPKADPKQWDPQFTYLNKYKNGDPTHGAKFPGSTTVFVGLTDPKHGFQFVEHALLFTTVSFSIGGGKDKILWHENKWKYIGKKASECALMWVGYNLGFTVTHDLFYGIK